MLGTQANVKDQLDLGDEIPWSDPYKDDLHNNQTFPKLDEEPQETTEWRVQYVQAENFIPTEDKMARGQVVHCEQDADGKPIGKSKKKPHVDTCLYEVKLSGGEVTELAVNIIPESMLVQCNAYKNENLKT